MELIKYEKISTQ